MPIKVLQKANQVLFYIIRHSNPAVNKWLGKSDNVWWIFEKGLCLLWNSMTIIVIRTLFFCIHLNGTNQINILESNGQMWIIMMKMTFCTTKKEESWSQLFDHIGSPLENTRCALLQDLGKISDTLRGSKCTNASQISSALS